MTQVFTKVTAGVGYACYGRKTRAEAIAEARASYEYSLKEAQAFLATPDDEMEASVIRGAKR